MSSIDVVKQEAFAREVSEHLSPKFGGRVPPETIEEYAREAYDALADGARILDYISVLGERDVLLRLRVDAAHSH
jgi:hypothetical protein